MSHPTNRAPEGEHGGSRQLDGGPCVPTRAQVEFLVQDVQRQLLGVQPQAELRNPEAIPDDGHRGPGQRDSPSLCSWGRTSGSLGFGQDPPPSPPAPDPAGGVGGAHSSTLQGSASAPLVSHPTGPQPVTDTTAPAVFEKRMNESLLWWRIQPKCGEFKPRDLPAVANDQLVRKPCPRPHDSGPLGPAESRVDGLGGEWTRLSSNKRPHR